MTINYTTLLGLAKPVTGTEASTWGTVVNDGITSLLDTAIAGTTTITSTSDGVGDGDVTLTTTTGAANQARQAIILWTGTTADTRTITAPAQSKTYVVINKITNGQSIKLVGPGPTTGVTIIAGESAVCAWNGVDFIKIPTPQYLSITFIIDGGGAVIGTGIKGDLTIPFACTIHEWTLLADQSGSITVDIWKDTYALYPPDAADKITASVPPAIVLSNPKAQSSTLTGWTTTISAGDTLRFTVTACTLITRVTLSLKVSRT